MKSLPLPLSTASPIVRPAGSGVAPVHGQAWQKAMESEQMKNMQQAKSVVLGEKQISQPASEVRSSRWSPPATLAPSFPRQTANVTAIPRSDHPTGAYFSNITPLHSNPPARPVAAMLASVNVPASAQQGMDADVAASHSPALAACMAERYQQKWPLRNVHVEQVDEGITVWIRDASLAEDQQSLHALIDRMREAMQQDGIRLAGIVINGKPIN